MDKIDVYVNGVKTDDIVQALRKVVVMSEGMAVIRDEAAREIERLRSRLAEAEALLRESRDLLESVATEELNAFQEVHREGESEDVYMRIDAFLSGKP